MSVREYVGARYVPILADPLEWDSTKTYEPLTIVINEGDSYTSRQFVPAGIQLTNTKYWAHTADFNAQLEKYRQEVQQISQDVQQFSQDVANIQGDVTIIQGDINTIEQNITNIQGSVTGLEKQALSSFQLPESGYVAFVEYPTSNKSLFSLDGIVWNEFDASYGSAASVSVSGIQYTLPDTGEKCVVTARTNYGVNNDCSLEITPDFEKWYRLNLTGGFMAANPNGMVWAPSLFTDVNNNLCVIFSASTTKEATQTDVYGYTHRPFDTYIARINLTSTSASYDTQPRKLTLPHNTLDARCFYDGTKFVMIACDLYYDDNSLYTSNDLNTWTQQGVQINKQPKSEGGFIAKEGDYYRVWGCTEKFNERPKITFTGKTSDLTKLYDVEVVDYANDIAVNPAVQLTPIKVDSELLAKAVNKAVTMRLDKKPMPVLNYDINALKNVFATMNTNKFEFAPIANSVMMLTDTDTDNTYNFPRFVPLYRGVDEVKIMDLNKIPITTPNRDWTSNTPFTPTANNFLIRGVNYGKRFYFLAY